jgi:hypothetical protein
VTFPSPDTAVPIVHALNALSFVNRCCSFAYGSDPAQLPEAFKTWKEHLHEYEIAFRNFEDELTACLRRFGYPLAEARKLNKSVHEASAYWWYCDFVLPTEKCVKDDLLRGMLAVAAATTLIRDAAIECGFDPSWLRVDVLANNDDESDTPEAADANVNTYTDRQKLILETMLQQDATSHAKRTTRAIIVHAVNPNHLTQNYKRDVLV